MKKCQVKNDFQKWYFSLIIIIIFSYIFGNSSIRELKDLRQKRVRPLINIQFHESSVCIRNFRKRGENGFIERNSNHDTCFPPSFLFQVFFLFHFACVHFSHR